MGHYYVIAGVYVLMLFALTASIARNVRHGPMLRTALTFVGVYLFQLAYSYTIGAPGQEMAFIVADAVAAAIILLRPSGRAQALIGLTYLLQMAMHAAKALLGTASDPVVYWWFVTAAAFLQLLLLGGWWIHVRLSDHRTVRHPAARAGAFHHASPG